MTSFLAPESPRPFSVAAERYFQQINLTTGLPVINHERTYSTHKSRFGEQYEREFCFYLAKHAEVNCNDRICLIGEESDWAAIVQERLFLIKPVHFIDCKLHHGECMQETKIKKKAKKLLFSSLSLSLSLHC